MSADGITSRRLERHTASSRTAIRAAAWPKRSPRSRWWLLAELTYRCPLQCPYCSNPLAYARHDQELDTAAWLRVLREARALGASQLGFSGGEPLARKDLVELVAEARRLGYYTNLITSAIGLDEARLVALKDAGLDNVHISFQASTRPSSTTRILPACSSFARKLEAARLVKARGFLRRRCAWSSIAATSIPSPRSSISPSSCRPTTSSWRRRSTTGWARKNRASAAADQAAGAARRGHRPPLPGALQGHDAHLLRGARLPRGPVPRRA